MFFAVAGDRLQDLRRDHGPPRPDVAAFVRSVLTTGGGWAMIAVGCGVGFLFALLASTISVVSFPLLLDRDVGLATAVATSIRAVRENPGVMTCGARSSPAPWCWARSRSCRA